MFSVNWFQTPTNDLIERVEEEPSLRESVVAAIREAERRLSQAPLDEGESRDEGRRCTYIDPLFLTFQIDMDNRRVTITHVHLYRSRH